MRCELSGGVTNEGAGTCPDHCPDLLESHMHIMYSYGYCLLRAVIKPRPRRKMRALNFVLKCANLVGSPLNLGQPVILPDAVIRLITSENSIELDMELLQCRR